MRDNYGEGEEIMKQKDSKIEREGVIIRERKMELKGNSNTAYIRHWYSIITAV